MRTRKEREEERWKGEGEVEHLEHDQSIEKKKPRRKEKETIRAISNKKALIGLSK
jgi:hypothetical protein